ncbi:MAG TPA: transglutaminase family protein [Micropepsaceae bacterium]|jgi:transglutaminase-like putative cysteine protease|nr:transglutaminase family protein [Micropepsaceae bacterium]
MDYRVRHRTTYRYAQDVSYSHHIVHLSPRDTATQRVEDFTLTISPATAHRVRREDFFGNATEWLALNEPHAVIDIVAQSKVAAFDPPERDAEASDSWEEVRARLEAADEDTHDIVQYVFDSPLTAFTVDLPAYASDSFTPGRPVLAAALELMSRIHADFRYDTTVTDASTPVDRVFEMRAGVCQDLAHIGIAMMRSLGLPARYVSGYLLTRPPPGQPRLVGADASHAWFSVWAPPYGWVDLDPTNDVIPGEEHITVAWGRDYWDVAPMNGIVIGGADHLIEVGVDVIPID